MPSTEVTIDFDGHTVSHRRPGPWTVRKFESGFAAVVNASGINWLSGLGGKTLLPPELANIVAAELNETYRENS